MTRFTLILPLVMAGLALPVTTHAQEVETAAPLSVAVVPQPRPEGLVARNQAAAVAAAEAAERAAAAPQPAAPEAAAQVADSPAVPEAVDARPTPDRAAIAAQITGAIRNCWNVGRLSEEAMAVRIWLAFDTTPEGEVIRDTIEMSRFDNGTQEAAEEALGPAFAAIMRCGNEGLDLPVETHPIWQSVEILFDASSVVTR